MECDTRRRRSALSLLYVFLVDYMYMTWDHEHYVAVGPSQVTSRRLALPHQISGKRPLKIETAVNSQNDIHSGTPCSLFHSMISHSSDLISTQLSSTPHAARSDFCFAIHINTNIYVDMTLPSHNKLERLHINRNRERKRKGAENGALNISRVCDLWYVVKSGKKEVILGGGAEATKDTRADIIISSDISINTFIHT